jgi:hypothetical protein
MAPHVATHSHFLQPPHRETLQMISEDDGVSHLLLLLLGGGTQFLSL